MVIETQEEMCNYLEELKANGYTLHHGSWASGYLSRSIAASVEPYKGQFGKGYVLHIPCRTSTRYHQIQYYIKES